MYPLPRRSRSEVFPRSSRHIAHRLSDIFPWREGFIFANSVSFSLRNIVSGLKIYDLVS